MMATPKKAETKAEAPTVTEAEPEPTVTAAELFERLGAPLFNSEWSLGAMHPDGTLYLSVLADEVVEGAALIYSSEAEDSPARSERWMHVSRLRAGHPCFLILARDGQLDDETLYVGGELFVDKAGDIRVRIVGEIKMPIHSIDPEANPAESD